MAQNNVATRFDRSKNEMNNERPTVRPPIDLVAYARESESLLRSALPLPRRSELESHTRIRNEDLVSPDAVATLIMSDDDLAWFELSPEASAIVRLVDGKRTLETVAAASGAPLFDCLRGACELIEQGIVRIATGDSDSL